MSFHVLKCNHLPFTKILRGIKTFEFRKNDRNYQVDDRFVLQAWDDIKGEFTVPTQTILGRITYVLGNEYGVPDGYCVFSFVVLSTLDGAAEFIDTAVSTYNECRACRQTFGRGPDGSSVHYLRVCTRCYDKGFRAFGDDALLTETPREYRFR